MAGGRLAVAVAVDAEASLSTARVSILDDEPALCRTITSIFLLGRALGIWQYYDTGHHHDHDRRGFLVERPITRNHWV